VNGIDIFQSPPIYVEFTQEVIRVVDGERGLEMVLERVENGRLSAACKESVTQRLREFIKVPMFRPRPRALCAIPARGVSLRQISLPLGARENVEELLHLQIEAEFPVAPEDLAWGYQRIEASGSLTGASAVQDFLIVAVKREVITEYSEMFGNCGLAPTFTVAALGRLALLDGSPGEGCLLELGEKTSELIVCKAGVPTSIRVLPGAQQLTSLASAVENVGARKIQVTGGTMEAPALQRVATQTEIEIIETPTREGHSSAIEGLNRTVEKRLPLIVFEDKKHKSAQLASEPSQWKWAAVAIALGLACLALRYTESVFHKQRVSKKYAEIKAFREKMPELDRQLNFLQFIKTNQPSYLDALTALAASAPQGLHIQSLSMSRRGELSFKGMMRDSQQMMEFRSKMIDSGGFTNVVVEEQTPTQDRQNLNVRISAQWSGNVKALPLNPKEKPGAASRPPGVLSAITP
jgi:hypothetical protein